MNPLHDPPDWAREEFGHANLGDSRRVARLVLMATRFATTPGGTVTAVFSDDAELQGAYDWLENDHVDPAAVLHARDVATARRARGQSFVFVATDGSSLTITDRAKTKETGRLGTRRAPVRGDKVHTAVVITPDGTPLGICAQQYWLRPERSPRKATGQRPVTAKETQRWLDVREQTRAVFLAVAPTVRVWFQHDREADAWPIVWDAVQAEADEWTTIRAAWDRRLIASADDPAADGETRRLRAALAATDARGRYALDVKAGRHRQARQAVMEVRFTKVTLDLRNQLNDRRVQAPVSVVMAREVSPVPEGESPLEWLLVTTYPVPTFEDACLVVFGYTQRWRIEEFHKAWQTGCCQVQDTQLAAQAHRLKWYAIASAVAMRLVRLTYLAREQPERLATQEFTGDELEAMAELRPRRTMPPRERMTLAEAVRWIAQIGGYTGKSSGGPPGMITLARGLEKVQVVATAFRNRRLRQSATASKKVDS